MYFNYELQPFLSEPLLLDTSAGSGSRVFGFSGRVFCNNFRINFQFKNSTFLNSKKILPKIIKK